MAILSRRAFVALAAGVYSGLTVTGCGDAGTMAYFLMPEQRIEAKIKQLAVKKNDKKDPRVAILTYRPELETRPEFINAGPQLADLLGRDLKELALAGNEKLTLLPARKVEEFKGAHPNWREMDLPQVGRRLGVDYLIYLEIDKLSLYEPGSYNTLMRGRTSITVQLIDVSRPEDLPRRENYSCAYPKESSGQVQVGTDMEPYQFRDKFLNFVSRELSHHFASYPRDERYRME